jgi:hypothetical protein
VAESEANGQVALSHPILAPPRCENVDSMFAVLPADRVGAGG